MATIVLDSCALRMILTSSPSILPRNFAQNVHFSGAPIDSLGLQSHKLNIGMALPMESSLALICNAHRLNSCTQLFFQIPDSRTNFPGKVSTSNAAARASLASDLFKRAIRCLMKTPARIFLKQLEGEIDKVADIIEEGAEMVKDIAEKVDYVAEEAEIAAKEAEKLATEVDEKSIKIEKKVDDLLQAVSDIEKASPDGDSHEEISKGT